LPCHLRHFSPFVPIHRRLRGLDVERSTRLNFNETQNIGVPADQVDLSPAARRPEIAFHHHIPQLPQMEVGILFSLRPGALVPRPRIGREHAVPNPIQSVNDGSRKKRGKHNEQETSL
jgi:hypothetical protein